jgi:hypothetical protein
MREDAHVDAFGGADQTVEIAAETALPPTIAAAAAHIDLGDAALAGEAQNGLDGVFTGELDNLGSADAARQTIQDDRDER